MGFASESIFNHYAPGEFLIASGEDVDDPAPQDVVTPEDASEALVPLIRPLPNLLSEVGGRT